jgi:xylan 1,4-beta-xylosidase
VALLAWNCVYDDEMSDGENPDTRTLSVSVPVGEANVFVKRRTVHEEVGNACTVWRQMGRPRFPTREQLAVLRECSVPAVSTAVREPADGRLELELTLSRNEITLVELTPVRDETSGYPGLDDTMVARSMA